MRRQIAKFSEALRVNAELSEAGEQVVGRTWDEKIALVYGTPEAYEAAKAQIGIDSEQAARFEEYDVLLQVKQLEFAYWARRCDLDDGPVELAVGGARGGSKSFSVLAQTGLDDCQRFPGLKVLYLRYTKLAAGEQLQDLLRQVLGKFTDVRITGNRIRFGNGSVIVVGGFQNDSEAAKYQGIEYDLVIIEEATQIRGETYKLLRASNRSSKVYKGRRWRPRTYLSFNPLGIGHAFFKQRFVDPERQKRQTSDRKMIFSGVRDNVFLNREYIKILEDLSGALRRAWLDGDWDVAAGAFFETWRYDDHTFEPMGDIHWLSRLWMSMDYGFNHPNVIQLHGKDGDGVYYTLHEWVHRKSYPDEIYGDVVTTLRQVYGLSMSDIKTVRAGADIYNKTGTSKFTIEQQYRKLGFPVRRAETAAGSRIGGAQMLNRLLGNPAKDRAALWLISRQCVQLIEQLPLMQIDPDNSEDVLKVDADEGAGGDDSYDCARYGIYNPRASKAA